MKKTIIVLFLLNLVIYANGKPNSVDMEIMNHGLNFEFEKADRILSTELGNTESLKKHFLYLNIELLKVIKLTDDAPYNKRRAVKDSLNKVIIDYAEKVVDKYEDNDLNEYDQFYLGSVYGVLGRLHGVSRSWMSAFSSGKDGRDLMEEIIERNPNFTDAYLLVGMMNYYADRMGGFIEFVAGILGLSGDREVGLKYLQKVEKEGTINNWQATMMLIELYSRLENNKIEAIPLLEKLVKRFPKNTHFKNWLCSDYISLHQVEKAGEMIKADDQNEINDFIKAAYYNQIGNYEKSNELYEKVLSKKGGTWPWVYENAKFVRAVNYLNLGDVEKAKKHAKELNERYTEIINPILKHPELSTSISELEKEINLNNRIAVNKFIESPPKFENALIFEAEYNYYLGVYYFNNSELTKAEDFFIKAMQFQFDQIISNSASYLINIYKNKSVSVKKVEYLLDKIDDLDDERLEFSAQDLETKYNL